MPAETSKETRETMSSFDCRTKVKEEEKQNDDDTKRRRCERKEDVKTKPKPEKEEEAEGDECSICLEILPKDITQFQRFTRRGTGIHIHFLVKCAN